MPIALEPKDQALADAAAELCRRRAPVSMTREHLDRLAKGELGPAWADLGRQGFLNMHLPEELGGGAASLMELAVVAEQFGQHLLPGPWLPTVLASATVCTALSSPAARPVLAEFADGAVGAVALEGMTAVEEESGFRVSGLSTPIAGLVGSDLVLIKAQAAARSVWFVVSANDLVIEPAESLDLTMSLGRFSLDWHHVAASDVLDVDEVAAELIRAALVCAQAAGVCAWTVESSVEHLRTRHQFGRPLGSFQALQHRAAHMLVRSESAVSAAWDAARAELQHRAQWPVAAAQALVTGPEPAVDNVYDFVTMLGALGITWEHDAHLYQRKAMALASFVGSTRTWARRLGGAALAVERSSRVDDPQILPQVRAEVGAVLDEFLSMPAEDDRHLDPWGRWTGGERQQLLASAGLIAPHLAPPYGRGAGPEEQAVIADEFGRRGMFQPTLIVGDWALATLVAHGTQEQKDRFIGPSQLGDIVWCQLFSEPEAGSDLASLRTRARKVEGGWRLTGQKIWNSRACEAQWGICLARSDGGLAKHEGLTYFLVDMSSEGVDARAIPQVNGQAELAEVFLDDVFVPDDCVVGQPGDGWRLAVTTLSSERLNMGSRLKYGSSRLVAKVLDEHGIDAERDDVLEVVGACTAREICLASMNLRTVLGRMAGLDMGAEISVNKVLNSTAQRDGSRALLSLLGPLALAADNPYVDDYLGMPAMMFGGGTLEVQLNVIAARVLKLPRA